MSPEHETVDVDAEAGVVITIGWKQVFLGGIAIGYGLCYWTLSSTTAAISILISSNVSNTIDIITDTAKLLSF